jgi:DNA-directed RNA polymerase specialized sigma24 family protein
MMTSNPMAGGNCETLAKILSGAMLLSGVIRRLRPNLRTTVELQQAHEYSTQELAESLGISVGAAKSGLSRA